MRSSDLPPVRRSIEVEYWVIDADGRLTSPGSLVDASPGAEQEFVTPILEVKTTPCETTAELRNELFERLRRVLRHADDQNKGLVPLATSLTRDDVPERPSDRTRIQNRVIGDNFQYVRHCAGTHIHFEQQPGFELEQLNTLIALDPALALVNSARHFRGTPIGPGARSKLYRWRAYDGLPNQGQLWKYASTREDWDDRLATCYDAFQEKALTEGIDPDLFASCFDPADPGSAVWAPVKLRPTFGTVEWRSPDTAFPAQVVRLADTMASIVDRIRRAEVHVGTASGHVGDHEIVLPTFETVRDHVDAAIRDGLSSESVRSYLSRMGFEVDAYTPTSATLPDTPLSVRDGRELRREYAAQLREDVLHANPVEA